MGFPLKNLTYINFVITSIKERKKQEKKKDIKKEATER